MSISPMTLEGALSVSAALEAARREIFEILIDQDKRFDQRLAEIRRCANQATIKLKCVPSTKIEEYATGKSHGGVVALAGAR